MEDTVCFQLFGSIYVVDSSDSEERLEESKQAFVTMLENNYMKDKPILL